MKLLSAFSLLVMVGVVSTASASTLSGGPSLTPPGGGTCTVTSGRPNASGGATISCSGLNLSATTRLYYGVKVTSNPFGETMDNSGVGNGNGVFHYSSSGSNSITYTGSTQIYNNVFGAGYQGVTTTATVSFQAGTGTLINDSGTNALDGNGLSGSPHALWRVSSSSFTANVTVTVSGTAASSYFDGVNTQNLTGEESDRVEMAFYWSSCGDGTAETGTVVSESCDQGVNNGGVSCCTTGCQIRTAGTICRNTGGDCDITESCDGVSPLCPADSKSTSQCRGIQGICDLAENCDGVNNACPTDVFKSSSTLCRASVDVCDQAENCTGSSPACPSDGKKSAATECRAAAGDCDQAENCNGSSDSCPADVLKSASVTCRAASGACDVAENCDGSSALCPTDLVVPNGTSCRAAAGVCDAAEFCDGSSKTCPTDVLRPNSFTCRAAAGVCDEAELCTGFDVTCPTDTYKGNTVPCRPAADVCDKEELCTGSGVNCPADQFFGATVECRPSGGVCDPREVCSGSAAACPADVRSGTTQVCRPSAGVCDVADRCDGINPDCPADSVQPTTLLCRSASGICDLAENCDGVNPTCPADSVAPDTSPCRNAAGVCDAVDYCDGSTKTCPPDQKLTDECRPQDGPCDVAEFCDGVTNQCPGDTFRPGSFVCRAANGVCDVDEQCSGVSGECPVDAFKPSSVVCRAAVNGSCDLAENCTGTTPDCPTDAVANEGEGCPGNNNNTCLNTCQSGDCVADVRPDCCGNGLPDLGEECDDGNQSTDVDACPSAPGQECDYTSFIRGERKDPLKDKYGCQLEWFVANPNNPLDKRLLPDRDQTCKDNDVSCDSDMTPGICRFNVVVCLNTDDAALACLPSNGISSVLVKPISSRVANTPLIGTAALQNREKVNVALTQLLDPAHPEDGWSKAPPLSATQKNLCSQPMTMDVYTITGLKDKAKKRLVLRTKSKDSGFPRPKVKNSMVRLLCIP